MAKIGGGGIGSLVGGIGGALIGGPAGAMIGSQVGGMAGGAVAANRLEDNAKYARTQGMFGGPRVRPMPPEMQESQPTMIPFPVPSPQRMEPMSLPSREMDPAATQVSGGT